MENIFNIIETNIPIDWFNKIDDDSGKVIKIIQNFQKWKNNYSFDKNEKNEWYWIEKGFNSSKSGRVFDSKDLCETNAFIHWAGCQKISN